MLANHQAAQTKHLLTTAAVNYYFGQVTGGAHLSSTLYYVAMDTHFGFTPIELAHDFPHLASRGEHSL